MVKHLVSLVQLMNNARSLVILGIAYKVLRIERANRITRGAELHQAAKVSEIIH